MLTRLLTYVLLNFIQNINIESCEIMYIVLIIRYTVCTPQNMEKYKKLFVYNSDGVAFRLNCFIITHFSTGSSMLKSNRAVVWHMYWLC